MLLPNYSSQKATNLNNQLSSTECNSHSASPGPASRHPSLTQAAVLAAVTSHITMKSKGMTVGEHVPTVLVQPFDSVLTESLAFTLPDKTT